MNKFLNNPYGEYFLSILVCSIVAIFNEGMEFWDVAILWILLTVLKIERKGR